MAVPCCLGRGVEWRVNVVRYYWAHWQLWGRSCFSACMSCVYQHKLQSSLCIKAPPVWTTNLTWPTSSVQMYPSGSVPSQLNWDGKSGCRGKMSTLLKRNYNWKLSCCAFIRCISMISNLPYHVRQWFLSWKSQSNYCPWIDAFMDYLLFLTVQKLLTSFFLNYF